MPRGRQSKHIPHLFKEFDMHLTHKNRKLTGFIGTQTFGLETPLDMCRNTLIYPVDTTFFLSALRKPYKIGPYAHECDGVGEFGELVPDALITAQHRRFCPSAPPLEAQISRWLQDMGIADGYRLYHHPLDGSCAVQFLPSDAEWEQEVKATFETEPQFESLATVQKRFRQFVYGKSWGIVFEYHREPPYWKTADYLFHAYDINLGLSNVFPVIVQCHIAPEGTTLLLEHPDIGLHAKQQVILADLLVQTATERHINIVFETYSDALIFRLQRHIADGTITNEDIALYACSPQKHRLNFTALEIDGAGSVTNCERRVVFHSKLEDIMAMHRARLKTD